MTKDQAEEEGVQGDHCLRAGGDETILDGDEELRCGEWKGESKFLQTNIKTWSGRNASNQEAKPWCCTCFEDAQGVQISNEASSGLMGAGSILDDIVTASTNLRLGQHMDMAAAAKGNLIFGAATWQNVQDLRTAMQRFTNEWNNLQQHQQWLQQQQGNWQQQQGNQW